MEFASHLTDVVGDDMLRPTLANPSCQSEANVFFWQDPNATIDLVEEVGHGRIWT